VASAPDLMAKIAASTRKKKVNVSFTCAKSATRSNETTLVKLAERPSRPIDSQAMRSKKLPDTKKPIERSV